jgi:hypothetical protein
MHAGAEPPARRNGKRSESGKPIGNYLAGIKHYVQVGSLHAALPLMTVEHALHALPR